MTVNLAHICRKLLKFIEGKNCKKWAKRQNIYDFEKEINPRGCSDPDLGLLYLYMTIIVKQIYWCIYISDLRSAFTGPLVLW